MSGNGADSEAETIRVYFDLSNMSDVRAVLAFAETMGLHMRMAPIAQRHGYRRGTTPQELDTFSKMDRFKLGDVSKLPENSEAKERWPHIEKIVGKQSQQYHAIVTQLRRAARIDKRRAGFSVAFMIRAGALVKE